MAREKLYYSISEVAEMFDVNQSKLRFWEKEFKQLKPRRTDKGTRTYTKEDIRTIEQIKFLTENQKLKIDGAKRRLAEKKDLVEKQRELVEKLGWVRNELNGLIAKMDKTD